MAYKTGARKGGQVKKAGREVGCSPSTAMKAKMVKKMQKLK